MKSLRIVRSEGSKEIIKFIEISKHCTQKEFSSVIQHFFGNNSTIGFSQAFCESSGKKTSFENFENGKTYFVTFEKKDNKSLLTWENAASEFVSLTNSSRLKVLDQSEYLSSRISETKSLVNDKATELIIRQEDSLLTLKQSLSLIHNTLGSQSLKILDYSAKANLIMSKVKYLIPLLQQSMHDLRQTNDDLRTVYAYKPPLELMNREKKRYLDPRIINYMKKFSHKDMPMNELTPGEMRRFMKFQMTMDNQITPMSSQNTPSSKRSKKIEKFSPLQGKK